MEVEVLQEKKLLAPKLRFKAFKGKWYSYELQAMTPLNEKYGIVDGPFGSNLKTIHYKNEGIPIITSGYVTNGFFYASEYLYVTEEKFQKERRSAVKAGDIVMAKIGARCGASAILPIGHQIGILSGNALKITIDETRFSSQVVWQVLLNLYNTHMIDPLRTVGAQPAISIANLKKFKVSLPTLPEQQKIASFLSAVDEKIQQLTRKKELLEQYKKGVMLQLFSGKLRFKDENGKVFPKWVEKRLGDVGDIVTGKTPSTADLDLWNGEIQFVTPTDINNNKYQINTQRTVKKLASTRLLPAKSTMFTCIASIGKMSLSIKPCITNQQINSVVPYEGFDNEFVYYSLLNISGYIKSTQSTTTLPIINKTEFSKFKIKVPSEFEEQKKIATYLSNIDNKIESINNQITHTQTFKKGLLQQMFV